MAKFFVGQRVKLVDGIDIGNTGVVVGFDWSDDCPVDVKFDRAGPCLGDEFSGPGEVCGCEPDDLEPILPEGMQPANWSDCAWQPEHLRSKA